MKSMLVFENFKLKIEPRILENDLSLPINGLLEVEVESSGFTARTSMDIDVKTLNDFARDLSRIYETLSGEARIQESYGFRMYIAFIGDGKGHVSVRGNLSSNQAGCRQSLLFENCIDQTCLKNFCRELNDFCDEHLRKE